MLEDRLQGLSTALENASVEKSKQRTLLRSMKKELKETEGFINVSYVAIYVNNHHNCVICTLCDRVLISSTMFCLLHGHHNDNYITSEYPQKLR